MTFIIGTPHTHGAGFHRNDDRLSGGRLDENDVQSCPHCQAVILMQQWRKARVQNFCTRCMKPTCNAPYCVQDCHPFLEHFAQHYDAVIKYQQYLKMAGLEPRPIPLNLVLPK